MMLYLLCYPSLFFLSTFYANTKFNVLFYRYRQYKSDAKECENCPLRERCTKSKDKTKVINRHLWEAYREQAEEIRHTQEWKEIYPKRKETIERVFADCKENNGLRYTRLRGLKKNQQNAWLIFACHNLKKVAIWRSLC